MIDTDELIEMLRDILRGKPAPQGEDADRRELRERMAAEVEAIRAAGGVIDIPPEVP